MTLWKCLIQPIGGLELCSALYSDYSLFNTFRVIVLNFILLFSVPNSNYGIKVKLITELFKNILDFLFSLLSICSILFPGYSFKEMIEKLTIPVKLLGFLVVFYTYK